jgi:hypothetical protein
MAGYSGTPLDRKLGLADGQRILLVGAPDGLIPVRAGASVLRSPRPPVDVAVVFVTARADLGRRMPALLRALPPTGALWVAWPKKASGVATDMTEDVVREVGLPTGLVDNKVCAIDDTWSGLRLVVRRERRPTWNQ